MNIMKIIEAEMTLMEGKELISSFSYPANIVLECLEEAHKRLGELIEEVKKNPQNWERADDATNGIAKRYQIETKLVRLKDEYLKSIG